MRRPLPSHYFALVTAAAARGWPLTFKTDLTKHDRRFLRDKDSKLPFLWVLRDSGTHLVYPDWRDIEHTAPDYPRMIEHAFDGATCLWFWWDGHSLRQLRDAREARETLERAQTVGLEEYQHVVGSCVDAVDWAPGKSGHCGDPRCAEVQS